VTTDQNVSGLNAGMSKGANSTPLTIMAGNTVNSVDSDPVVPGDVDPTLFVGEEQ
jgi:hypothetical protein